MSALLQHDLMPWVLAAAVIAAIVLLRIAQRGKNSFDLVDLLCDPATGKASVSNVVLLGLAVVSAWAIVHRELAGREIDGVLGLTLGAFVVKGAFGQVASVMKQNKGEQQP